MPSFNDLPFEIVLDVLQYLPIKDLFSFGLTSTRNRVLQEDSLTTLRLGVFHSKLSGMINLLEATVNTSCVHNVQMILPQKGSKNKDCVIHTQNRSVQDVVRKYSRTLKDLEISIWDLQEGTVSLLAELPRLRHLSLRLDHPHTRHPSLKQNFWQQAPGSTAWNLLVPQRGHDALPGRLRSLSLDRAGVTDYQLRAVLKHNPNIKELYLRKCFNLTKDIFKFLATSKSGRQIEVLHFTMVDKADIDERILDYIGRMPNLQVSSPSVTLHLGHIINCMSQALSLHGCRSIDTEALEKASKTWKLSSLTMPFSVDSPPSRLEVDPAYR